MLKLLEKAVAKKTLMLKLLEKAVAKKNGSPLQDEFFSVLVLLELHRNHGKCGHSSAPNASGQVLLGDCSFRIASRSWKMWSFSRPKCFSTSSSQCFFFLNCIEIMGSAVILVPLMLFVHSFLSSY
jgi:hypothetical protein